MPKKKPEKTVVKEENPYQQLSDLIGPSGALSISSAIAQIGPGKDPYLILSAKSGEIVIWAREIRVPTGVKIENVPDFRKITALVLRLYYLTYSADIKSQETVYFS